MIYAPGYTDVHHLEHELDKVLAAMSDEQYERLNRNALLFSHRDKSYSQLRGELKILAETPGTDQGLYDRLVEASRVRALFLTLQEAHRITS